MADGLYADIQNALPYLVRSGRRVCVGRCFAAPLRAEGDLPHFVYARSVNVQAYELIHRKTRGIEEILTSFIEAIMCYYAWICNEIDDSYEPNEAEVEEILQEYLRSRKPSD